MKYAIVLIAILAGTAWGQTLMPNTEPGCKQYAAGEKHLPNVPACKSPKRAPLKCDKYQVETIGVNANGVVDAMCVDIMHGVTEREWQELMEKIRWIDHIRAEQCPSLSWVDGKCLPFCDEIVGTQSCAQRSKK